MVLCWSLWRALVGRSGESAPFSGIPVEVRAYVKDMHLPFDAALLGTRAAHSVINAMVTEEWKGFHDRLTSLLSQAGSDGEAEIAAVDLAQEQLIEADREDLEVLQRASVRRISVRMEKFLTGHPQIADGLSAFLDEYSQRLPNSQSVGSQNATATRRGQVFQAGGAQTIYLSGRDR